MSLFEIEYVNDIPSVDCIVYSTYWENPIHACSDIEKHLKSNVKQIVFDCLLSNGNVYDRFVRADYVNGKLQNFDYIKDKELIERLRARAAKYYSQHPDYVDASILTSVQKKLVKKGLIIR